MHILLQESIDSSLLDAAETMLKDFIVFIPELYGESNCTTNAHMLLHLPKYTRLWGPNQLLGTTKKNGDLKRNIHGKSIIHQQLFHTQHRYISNTIASNKQRFVARESYDYILGPHTNFLGQPMIKTLATE